MGTVATRRISCCARPASGHATDGNSRSSAGRSAEIYRSIIFGARATPIGYDPPPRDDGRFRIRGCVGGQAVRTRRRRSFIHQRDVLQRGEARNKVVRTGTQSQLLAPISRELGVVRTDQIMLAPSHHAQSGRVEAAEDVEQGRFARARRPHALVNVALGASRRRVC
jgi:hypothetical protein